MECRRAESGSDQRVSEVRPWDRVHGTESGGDVRLGATSAGGARVCEPEQSGARGGSGLHQPGDRVELGAGRSVDPDVPGDEDGATDAVSTASVSPKVHGRGWGVAGSGRPRPRANGRAGDAVHSAAGVRRVRPDRVCTPGRDFSGASLQSAAQRVLSESSDPVPANTANGAIDRGATPARPARAAGLPASGHGGSRALGGSQRGISHQRR